VGSYAAASADELEDADVRMPQQIAVAPERPHGETGAETIDLGVRGGEFVDERGYVCAPLLFPTGFGEGSQDVDLLVSEVHEELSS
jgi:hypothetical protein